MTKQITQNLSITLFITLILVSLFGYRPALAADPPVLITEVQTGFIDEQGAEYSRYEFIELSNISEDPINVTGWKLEYLSATNTGTTPGTVIEHLVGQIDPHGYVLYQHEGYNPGAPHLIIGVGDVSVSGLMAKSGGHLRLMNGSTMVDCVAWGSATAITGCDKVSAVAGPGYTIQRQQTNGHYEKASGVANVKPSTPRGGDIYPVTIEPTIPVEPTPQKTCDSVQLSEILANPSGDDTTSEYIELYNPLATTQSLYGCVITLSNGKQYEFTADANLLAGEHRAFTYTTTGLQLTNSGMSVTLATISHDESITYPSQADDVSWAKTDGIWQASKQPTPNLANTVTLTSEETIMLTQGDIEECPAGKYRNPETGRCRNIVETTQPQTACAPDQERNPATGRCRKIALATAAVTCSEGQERNPTTNRCRKVEVAAATKPCEPGQERNAETGRCRKVTETKNAKVLGASTNKKTYHLFLVGLVLAVILGYGVYEYRHDIVGIWPRLKNRFGR